MVETRRKVQELRYGGRIEKLEKALLDRSRPPVAIKSTRLIDHIDRAFDEAELEELADAVGVDYQNLKGENKRAKARSLIRYMERHGRRYELVDACQKARPRIDWGGL